MTRPLLIDAFPFHDELDLLELRLTELYDTVDWFVLVEADVTHQDVPKPYHYLDNAERFAQWADKIIPVQATGLPTMADNPDPWAREVTQREHIATGLATIGVDGDDIVMQSDVDEIPRALHARNARPNGKFVAFQQRGHFWAVDWYWGEWQGTVAAQVDTIGRIPTHPFGSMRNMRNANGIDVIADAGWHLSWLGGPDRVTKKVNSFCHPEVEADIRGAIANDNFYWREGFHVDGVRLKPVDVDDSWPKWIVDGNAPDSWYRPR